MRRGSNSNLWGCALDAHRGSRRRAASGWNTDERMRRVGVLGHEIRLLDTGGDGPVVALAADAPVVLEHYVPLVDLLAPHRRVVALEMPGFGFSYPSAAYRFTLDEQVDVVLGLLDSLGIERAHLAFTCVNGLVACAAACRAPDRIERLTLGQLPGVEAYREWARRIDLKVAGHGLLATPGIGQALMALAPGRIAAMWFAGVSGPGADVEAITRVSQEVYRQGGLFCLGSINQALQSVTAEDVGPVSVPTTFAWGVADRSHRATDRASCLSIAPHAGLVEFPELGHCYDVEDPRRAAALILGREPTRPEA